MRWSGPDADVEVADRRRNRRRRRRKERTGDADEEEDNGAESRLNPPAMSTELGSPLAPRASPEPSDVDPISSPRWPRGSLVTPPGSAGGSPPLGAASRLTPAAVQSCRTAGSPTAERPDVADLDCYRSLHLTHANTKKGTCLGMSAFNKIIC